MMDRMRQVLQNMGESSSIRDIRTVAGGSISDAYAVETENRTYFVKNNDCAPAGMFATEAKGLAFIRETNTIRVPEVYYWDDHGIVMEWIEGRPNQQTDAYLGRHLACFHQQQGDKFGFSTDNFIGRLPQVNTWQEEWLAFYRDYRLKPQFEWAEKRGLLPVARARLAQRLLEQLSDWIPNDVPPRRLHGDLWGGNWLVGPGGHPYLIDPAVYFGHHECELAFTELFGGFSSRMYSAYQEILPVSSAYEDVKPLYQLYYLLVHLNLFGESYGAAVDRILKRYVG